MLGLETHILLNDKENGYYFFTASAVFLMLHSHKSRKSDHFCSISSTLKLTLEYVSLIIKRGSVSTLLLYLLNSYVSSNSSRHHSLTLFHCLVIHWIFITAVFNKIITIKKKLHLSLYLYTSV